MAPLIFEEAGMSTLQQKNIGFRFEHVTKPMIGIILAGAIVTFIQEGTQTLEVKTTM